MLIMAIMPNLVQSCAIVCNFFLSLSYHQLGVPDKAEITLFEPDPDNAGVGRQITPPILTP